MDVGNRTTFRFLRYRSLADLLRRPFDFFDAKNSTKNANQPEALFIILDWGSKTSLSARLEEYFALVKKSARELTLDVLPSSLARLLRLEASRGVAIHHFDDWTRLRRLYASAMVRSSSLT